MNPIFCSGHRPAFWLGGIAQTVATVLAVATISLAAKEIHVCLERPDEANPLISPANGISAFINLTWAVALIAIKKMLDASQARTTLIFSVQDLGPISCNYSRFLQGLVVLSNISAIINVICAILPPVMCHAPASNFSSVT